MSVKMKAVLLIGLLSLIICVPIVVHAGGQADSAATARTNGNSPRMESSIVEMGLRLLAAIALVVGLIYISIWALKKITAPKAAGRFSIANISIIDTYYLGPKKGLHIIRAGNKFILVGSSENTMSFLCDLDPEDFKNLNSAAIASKAPGRFREILEKLKSSADRPFLGKARNVETPV